MQHDKYVDPWRCPATVHSRAITGGLRLHDNSLLHSTLSTASIIEISNLINIYGLLSSIKISCQLFSSSKLDLLIYCGVGCPRDDPVEQRSLPPLQHRSTDCMARYGSSGVRRGCEGCEQRVAYGANGFTVDVTDGLRDKGRRTGI